VTIRRFLEAFGRQAPLFLPVLAVAVVGLVVLRLGKTHAVVGARLRGGPTEGAHTLSYRLELVERHGDAEHGVPGRRVSVEARLETGETMVWQGALDGEGAAAVSLSPRSAIAAGRSGISGPVGLRVTASGAVEPIAEARVLVTRARWAGTARRRGGWVEGPEVNGLRVRAAAAHGAFAVPFADPLLVDARRARGPFAGTITCECDSAGEKAPRLIYSSPGALPARALVRPLEHATSVPLVARDRDGTTALLDVTLAVVPGALHAELVAEGVRVESPILRDRAYVAVVTETDRLVGGTVVLHGTDRGTAEGVLTVRLPPQGPLWAVVSSEPDMGSAALVGWPLRDAERAPDLASSAPPTTFDVADVLVVDSVGDKVRRELGRARRVRVLAALFAALAILLSAVLVARRARTAQAALEAHLAASGTDAETTTKVATPDGGAAGLVVVAVLCLVLAATLVGVFAAWT
jgi:hypothetical protein